MEMEMKWMYRFPLIKTWEGSTLYSGKRIYYEKKKYDERDEKLSNIEPDGKAKSGNVLDFTHTPTCSRRSTFNINIWEKQKRECVMKKYRKRMLYA